MKRSRINPRSSRMAKELRLYGKLREKFLSENTMCQVCGWQLADEVHHKKGRGRYLNDVKFFLATCSDCHRIITDNPKWAFEKGYSIDRIGI